MSNVFKKYEMWMKMRERHEANVGPFYGDKSEGREQILNLFNIGPYRFFILFVDIFF